MSEKKEYRNAIRSRRLIRAAFVDLLNEKPFEKITATDIINRADINRSTFYAHYPQMRSVMDEIMDEIADQFQQMLHQFDMATFFENPEAALNIVHEFMEENQEMYRLLGRSPLAMEQLEKMKTILIRQIMASPNLPREYRNSLAGEVRVRMLMNGVVDTYRQWLAGDIHGAFEDITQEMITALHRYVKKDF